MSEVSRKCTDLCALLHLKPCASSGLLKSTHHWHVILKCVNKQPISNLLYICMNKGCAASKCMTLNILFRVFLGSWILIGNSAASNFSPYIVGIGQFQFVYNSYTKSACQRSMLMTDIKEDHTGFTTNIMISLSLSRQH